MLFGVRGHRSRSFRIRMRWSQIHLRGGRRGWMRRWSRRRNLLAGLVRARSEDGRDGVGIADRTQVLLTGWLEGRNTHTDVRQ